MATAPSLPRRLETRMTILFSISSQKFTVTRTVGQGARVAATRSEVDERTLRAIGDQDINETVDRAKYNPYREQTLRCKRRVF
jgi:hypothetical protein